MTSYSQVWDKGLATSTEWLKSLGSELGWDDASSVFLAFRSVLHALRDRLPPDEAVDLAAQMPLPIKGLYYDGWDPSRTPVKARRRDDFFGLVMKGMGKGLPDADPERVTRAVFRILAERVSEGEIRDVRMVLPAELSDLWPSGAGTL
jgi:uncharacterized protein (DUF2267 family)